MLHLASREVFFSSLFTVSHVATGPIEIIVFFFFCSLFTAHCSLSTGAARINLFARPAEVERVRK